VLLQVNNLNAGYGFLQILRDVSLQVEEGEFVCLIGPNGAGKSTTLKTIAGMLAPMSGEVNFAGNNIAGMPGHQVVKRGVCYISEEMNLFTSMTVAENLSMGAYLMNNKQAEAKQLEFVFGLFPRLEERQNQLAGTMSGGERKMLAIGRGLMSDPKLILVDEPSFGLAPQLTEQVFDSLKILNEGGATILVVEQNVNLTLMATDRGYVIENGKIGLEGPSKDLAEDDYVRKVFLGV
jgi:ABC-type branched-subunit amino acid transport system ATPase component